MTQEEKARAYDKALEKAKYLHEAAANDGYEVHVKTFESLFPELKESEDERIRKEILEFVTIVADSKSNKMEWITWLEKQGKQASAIRWYDTSLTPEEMMELLVEWETNDATWHEVAFYHADTKTFWDGERQVENVTRWCYIDDILEKQGEQKSIFDFNANNWYVSKVDGKIHNIYNSGVEPKFHKDEWVVNNATLNLCHILRVEHGQYICDDCSFPITKENEYHLWTIQDAKDGDILMANAPFIFNGNLEDGIDCPGAHCAINTLGKFQIPKSPRHWTGHTTIPATKEQRDLLFSKMKDAGYKWDAEKKELRKISQRMISAEAKETLYDKPAWSEEDEHRVKDTIYFLDTAKRHYASTVELDACINWLKTIKKRMEE